MLAILAAAAVLLPMARAQNRSAQEADEGTPDGDYKILLLDDRDDQDSGKDQSDDRLYLMDSKGGIEAAVTGFNISQTIGGCHVLAVDEQRRALWVAENAGGRLWQIDLATGQIKRKIPGLRASAVAVDPDTGNVWVVVAGELLSSGHIRVVSPAGQTVAEYQVPGFDITYSRHDDSFWVVGKTICRIGRDGKVLGKVPGEIPWMAASVSVDEKTGSAWVVVRDHPNVPESRPELWAVDKNARIQQRIDLGELMPFCVAADSDNEIVWVGCLGATLRYTTKGEKLRSARYASGFSIVPGPSANSVIAASQWELAMATVRDTGYVESGSPPREVRDLLSSSQKWVAKVSWSGAKLQSSPELANLMGGLTRDRDLDLKLADYPESQERLRSLGKALLMYANDYEDKLPDTLDGVQTFVSEADLKWLKDNVEYLGKGKTVSEPPDVVVAYDRTVLRKGEGTLVLYLDSHVAFEGPHKLERLGIQAVAPENVSRGVREASQRPPDETWRLESAKRLSALGKAALLFTIDHEHRLPEKIEDLPDNIGLEKSWLAENVTYLGKGMKTSNEPDSPVAYDKMMLLVAGGTNVLYLNTQVVFEGPQQLKRLGIIPTVDPRAKSRMELLEVGKSLLICANDFHDKFPDTLQDAKDYISENGDFPWVLENVTYLGKGVTARDKPGRVLAYDKTLLEKGAGTNVLYCDAHVEWLAPDRLPALGINTER
jgi:prepilin-type processing-associated H-X9-DG protein